MGASPTITHTSANSSGSQLAWWMAGALLLGLVLVTQLCWTSWPPALSATQTDWYQAIWSECGTCVGWPDLPRLRGFPNYCLLFAGSTIAYAQRVTCNR